MTSPAGPDPACLCGDAACQHVAELEGYTLARVALAEGIVIVSYHLGHGRAGHGARARWLLRASRASA